MCASEAKGTVNFRLHPRDNPETIINFVNDLIGNENIEVKNLAQELWQALYLIGTLMDTG